MNDEFRLVSKVVQKALFQLLFCVSIKTFCNNAIKLVCSIHLD